MGFLLAAAAIVLLISDCRTAAAWILPNRN